MITQIKNRWLAFSEDHPELRKFALFFALSNGITLLQLALMPVFRWAFSHTSLVDIGFQVLPAGAGLNGASYYIFDYRAGELPAGGGGLAYFLAVQITLLIAQVINFFAQRNITFKSNSNIWWAAFWYAAAYIAITFLAAASQGFYKAPIYELLMNTWKWGATGGTTADVIVMVINSAISFWVFYPIFKVIFRNKPETETAANTQQR